MTRKRALLMPVLEKSNFLSTYFKKKKGNSFHLRYSYLLSPSSVRKSKVIYTAELCRNVWWQWELVKVCLITVAYSSSFKPRFTVGHTQSPCLRDAQGQPHQPCLWWDTHPHPSPGVWLIQLFWYLSLQVS